MLRSSWIALFAVASTFGCGSKSDAPAETPTRSLAGHPKNAELPPDTVCPGDPRCPASDDGTLFAAATTEIITAPITEKLTFSAKGKPWEYHAAGGDKFDDANGNGVFDGTWMAGFGTGRAASGVHDEQYVRAVVLKQGNVKIAMVTIDCVGWFYDEVLRVRQQLKDEGVDVSYVFMAATHVHEVRDTMGIWGPDDATTGVSKDYNAFIRQKSVKAIKDSLAKLERANVTFGSIQLDGHLAEADPAKSGVQSLVGDGRDPVIIDLTMNTMRLTRAEGDKGTIATLVNFAAHPEFSGDSNTLLTSDFTFALRSSLEKGIADGPLKKPGLGGVAIFLQGSCGGQIGPHDVKVVDAAGKEYPRPDDMNPEIGIDRAQVIGTNYAYYALTSLEKNTASFDTVRIGFRQRQIFGAVENRGYHVAIASRLFDRKGWHFDESQPISADNQPDILTEVAVIDIGPAQLISFPGEVHPELVVGMGSQFTPTPYKLVQPDNKNPPDVSKAPAHGHIYELADPSAKYKWTLGLGNDEIGYLVPAWNYELDKNDPYYEEPPGDHYEETNSIGPQVEAHVIEPLRDLLKNTKTPIARP